MEKPDGNESVMAVCIAARKSKSDQIARDPKRPRFWRLPGEKCLNEAWRRPGEDFGLGQRQQADDLHPAGERAAMRGSVMRLAEPVISCDSGT